jgi:hypothetical protein
MKLFLKYILVHENKIIKRFIFQIYVLLVSQNPDVILVTEPLNEKNRT